MSTPIENKYKRYCQSSVTPEKLDELMAFILNSGTGYIGAIVAGLKIIVCVGYVIARNKLVDNELQAGRQEIEHDLQNQHNTENETVT